MDYKIFLYWPVQVLIAIVDKSVYFFLVAAFLAGFLAAFLAGFLAAFFAGFLAAFLAAGFLAAFFAGFLAFGFLTFLGFLAFLALGFLAFLTFLGLATLTSLYLPAPLPAALALTTVPLARPRLRASRRWTAALAASTLLLATMCLRMAWREEPPRSFSPVRAAAIMALNGGWAAGLAAFLALTGLASTILLLLLLLWWRMWR